MVDRSEEPLLRAVSGEPRLDPFVADITRIADLAALRAHIARRHGHADVREWRCRPATALCVPLHARHADRHRGSGTGLRRGELLGLRWEDVDLDRCRVRVVENYVRGQFKAPKSGKPREVPLSGEARAALAAHRYTRGERVFCDAEGKPFTQGVMASQLERACRLAGLRVIGWHVLRHTFASPW